MVANAARIMKAMVDCHEVDPSLITCCNFDYRPKISTLTADFDEIFDTHARATFLYLLVAAQVMIKRGRGRRIIDMYTVYDLGYSYITGDREQKVDTSQLFGCIESSYSILQCMPSPKK